MAEYSRPRRRRPTRKYEDTIPRTSRRQAAGVPSSAPDHHLADSWLIWDQDCEGLYDEAYGPKSMVDHPMVWSEAGQVSGTPDSLTTGVI